MSIVQLILCVTEQTESVHDVNCLERDNTYTPTRQEPM